MMTHTAALPPSNDSLRRFSLIKRKPAPSDTDTELFPTDPHTDGAAGGADHDHVLPRIPSFSSETEEFWNSLDNLGGQEADELPTARTLVQPPRQRRRAHTVPSRRFSGIVRIPPPKVDFDILAGAPRMAASLTSASMPDQTLHGGPFSDNMVSISLPLAPKLPPRQEPGTVLPQPPPMKDKPSYKGTSRFSFASKRDKTSNRLTAASVSSPQMGRQYSTTSTNMSMISLSAFPLPPTTTPSVPPPPSSSKLDLSPSRSFILNVDAPDQNAQTVYLATAASEPNLALTTTNEDEMKRGKKGKAPVLAAPRRDGPNEAYFDFGEPPDDTFNQTRLPTQRELEEAAALPVISETGVRIPFGRLWSNRKTIVCFIRHFWCPLCQDFMASISQNVSPQVLQSAGVDLVIISNGSFEMIKAYRRIFRTPYEVYTDPTHKVYNALGMTIQSLEKGPKGTYVRHGTLGGIGMVVANAAKVGMPVWKAGGEISQLGGEFVLGPGLSCSWAHRMRYTRNHVPILKVVEAAGVDMITPLRRESSTGGSFLGIPKGEELKWMDRRRKLLKKLRGKKLERRGGPQYQLDTASTITATTTNTFNSNRSSIGSQISASGSLCSWDPATEEAINVGLTNWDMEIIKEVEEEEERMESLATNDSKSEHTDFDAVSEAESSATEPESTEGGLVVEVSLEPTTGKVYKGQEDEDDMTISTSRSSASWSSFGSGYDAVVSSHLSLFEADELESFLGTF